MTLPTYDIQDWLFNYAHGKIKIDLAESGITPLDFHDIYDDEQINLNYTRDRGSDELRAELAKQYGVSQGDVVVTNGGQEALYLFYTVIGDNAEVITFRPGWQQSWAVPKAVGCDVTVLERLPDNDYSLPVDAIRASCSDRTEVVVVNSPQNPTGRKITSREKGVLNKVARAHDTKIIVDEEYRKEYSASLIHELSNAFSVASLSKIHGLPGLRTGWVIGQDETLLDKIVNAKRYTTVSNNAVSEQLATKALRNQDWFLNRYRRMTKDGWRILQDWAQAKETLRLTRPEGTPYAYCTFNDRTDSREFCKDLIDDHGVLLMPAEVFGDTQGFRITFARHGGELREGLRRISEAL